MVTHKSPSTSRPQVPVASQQPGQQNGGGNFSSNLSVLKTIPANGDNNIYPDQRLVVTFSQPIQNLTPSVQFDPNLPFTFQILGASLYIIPSQKMALDITYKVAVNVTGMTSPYNFSFSTSSQSTPQSNQVSDPGTQTFQAEEDFMRQNYPDSFLASKLPYSTSDFSAAVSAPKSQSNPSYGFLVTLIGSDQSQSKTDFINWAKSFGLTDNQIQQLNIFYTTPQQAQAVAKFKDSLPYYSKNLAITYDKTTDATSVVINQANRIQGDQAFSAYLQQFGITDKSEVNNLTISYQ